MRITSIRAAGLRGATPPGGWSDELSPDDVIQTLLSVHTDEGLVGIGSVSTDDRLVHAGIGLLAPLCVGDSALEPERVCESLHQKTFWMGRGGTLTHVISGIDIALWDVVGQALSAPVGRLLGGNYRDRVRPYASILMDEPEVLRDRIAELRGQRFAAFKIGWGRFGRSSPARDERIVATAREAAGDSAMLMVDAGASDAFWPNDLKWAIRTAVMLADYGVEWFEEPLPPDMIDEYRSLRSASATRIAGGETLTRRQTFRPWLEQPAVDVIQPDATKVGGLSEQRRIGWLAQDHGVTLIPHGWNTAVGLGADLQLAAALQSTDLVEYAIGSAYIDGLVAQPWSLDGDGMLPIPTRPGLAPHIDLDALSRVCPDVLQLGLPRDRAG